MTSDNDPRQIPGDPLLRQEPPTAKPGRERPEVTRQSRVVRPGNVDDLRARVHVGTNDDRRSPTRAGSGLLFSICAVFAVTVVLSQQGGATEQNSASITPNQSAVTEATNVEVEPSRLRVLVSDPANTAIVQEIAGGLVTVESIVPPGGNGHTYEPVPGDAIKAASADLFIENGMDLNPAVTNFVRANARADMPTVTLADAIPPNEVISTDTAEQIANHGHAHSFNAHFWTDPMYVIAYAERIKVALSNIDPANASTYVERAERFIVRLQVLDSAFRSAIASIPAENRKLVVYHDSWSYFGRRYGIPIVGAIQPVTFSEPSASEIRRMIDQIRNERVPAFFGSEVFPSDVLEAIARETGAAYYANLSDEELPGEPGAPEHSYEGLMIQNIQLIVSALGGDPSTVANLVPGADPS